jgi:hypothetical protein
MTPPTTTPDTESTSGATAPQKPDKPKKPTARSRKGAGGPNTPAGKAISSRNATKHGIWTRWFSDEEQDRYDHLVQELQAQHGDTITHQIVIESLASCLVKRARIDGAEDADFQRARLLKASIERQPHAGSIASTLPDTEQGRETAMRIATALATPAMEKLDLYARYATTLDRQIQKGLDALQLLGAATVRCAPAAASSGPPQLALVGASGGSSRARARR